LLRGERDVLDQHLDFGTGGLKTGGWKEERWFARVGDRGEKAGRRAFVRRWVFGASECLSRRLRFVALASVTWRRCSDH
jgi:hypothetical protein